MEIFDELRALQRDLIKLGDSVAVALLERAERCFLEWRFEDGERLREQALNHVQEGLRRPLPALSGASRHFDIYARAVAFAT